MTLKKALEPSLRRLTKIFKQFPCEHCPGWGSYKSCCSNCGHENGYLECFLSDTYITRLKRQYGFTRRKGFLGRRGCKLPRHLRSYICTSYYCETAYDTMDGVCKNAITRATITYMRIRKAHLQKNDDCKHCSSRG